MSPDPQTVGEAAGLAIALAILRNERDEWKKNAEAAAERIASLSTARDGIEQQLQEERRQHAADTAALHLKLSDRTATARRASAAVVQLIRALRALVDVCDQRLVRDGGALNNPDFARVVREAAETVVLYDAKPM